jgi:hypothetical protein
MRAREAYRDSRRAHESSRGIESKARDGDSVNLKDQLASRHALLNKLNSCYKVVTPPFPPVTPRYTFSLFFLPSFTLWYEFWMSR